MSASWMVPPGVPSVRQSSPPDADRAWKKTYPLAATNPFGRDPLAPDQMSLTRMVPAAVPSDFHSSAPSDVAYPPWKYNMSPTTVSSWGHSPAKLPDPAS